MLRTVKSPGLRIRTHDPDVYRHTWKQRSLHASSAEIRIAHRAELAVARAGWRYLDYDSLHALGTDRAALKILKGRVPYPCRAIFLSFEALTLPPTLGVSKLKVRLTDGEHTPSFVVVERSGVMLNEKMTSAERATLIGLMEIEERANSARAIETFDQEREAQYNRNTCFP